MTFTEKKQSPVLYGFILLTCVILLTCSSLPGTVLLPVHPDDANTYLPSKATEFRMTATEYPPTATEYPPTLTEYPPTATEYPPTPTEYQVTPTAYLMTPTEYREEYWTDKKFLGIYMAYAWSPGTVSAYLPPADHLAGKRHSVVGFFFNIEWTAYKLTDQLEALWQAGYTGFVNFTSAKSITLDQINNGDYDTKLYNLADEYLAWVKRGGGRQAFLAPLPEMNGSWTTYYGAPDDFIQAYTRIQDIFTVQGVPRNKVWWVFAPNGTSNDGDEFERFYPGDNAIDVVAFSSFNFGYCASSGPSKRWLTYEALFPPFIERMVAMAPSKPIIVAQTGTTAEYSYTGENNISAKDEWLRDNYQSLAQVPSVLGVIYFDIDVECLFRILPDRSYTGYAEGAAAPAYQYLGSLELKDLIP